MLHLEETESEMGLQNRSIACGHMFLQTMNAQDSQNTRQTGGKRWLAPLGLALGSPIFPSGCEGKLGVALESLQGLRDLT